MGKKVNEKNFKQWSVLPDVYDDSRPAPPEIIKKIILSWLGKAPNAVVDVGCGTGLSTIIWKDVAAEIIGIEPNDDMRAIADKNVKCGGIDFKKGISNEINLPSDYADIITVSQAFHFMDIDSTLFEFHRVLRENGILAIYDFTLPPIVGWEIEQAFLELRAKCTKIWYSQENPPVLNDKATYYDRIKSFGKFRYSREVECHSVKKWSPQKITEFLINISNASFAMGIDASIKGNVDEFRDFVKARRIGDYEIILPYKIVIAVK